MAFTATNPVREQLRTEILATLANAPMPMTTSAIYQSCPSATQSEEVARLAYELKRKGLLAYGGKVPHPRGMLVNSYVLATLADPRIEAAKPIKVERKIPKTIKPPKPAQDHPFKARIVAQEAHDGAPRVTRPLPAHLQSTAPQMAADELGGIISPNSPTTHQDHIMSEDPLHYVPDPDAFSLEPKEPEAEEDIDSDLVDALMGLAHMKVIEADSADDLLAKMVPLPMAEDDDDPTEMASADVGEIAAAMAKRQDEAHKVCKCLRINSLPPLPRGYRYAAISVDIVSDEDGESLNLLIADEGNGPFAQIDTTGKLRFDLGEMALISEAADALIKLLENGHE